MKKTTLIVLDGFGINDEKTENNAIKLADSPTFDKLFNSNYTKLDASSLPVGLPKGQMGNSEVGHLTIGAGRVIKQTIVEIDDMLGSGTFSEIIEFKDGINHALKNNSAINLFILFGDGGVHAHQNHLEGIIKLIPKEIKVKLHLFGDGRDLPRDSMLAQFEKFEEFLVSFKNVEVTTISGRFYAMDRDNNWDRVKKAYEVMCFADDKTGISSKDYIKQSYEKEIYDEFLEPINFTGSNIGDNEVIFHLNFRSDRAVELTKAFYDTDFVNFERKPLKNLYISTMTKYYKEYDSNIFIKSVDIKNTLGEVISKNNLKQLHLAETEKFAHVTKFFNGGKQVVFEGEDDILIPSKKVLTYDLDPTMSAYEIMEKYIEIGANYDFCVINFANGDMVGHTGNLEASIKAVEVLDEVIGKIINDCKSKGIEIFITADHGNCECMFDENHEMITSHTTNLVPFWHISNGENVELKVKTGCLADVAPTVLKTMGVDIPSEMDGKVLV